MKKIYLLFLSVLFFVGANAQVTVTNPTNTTPNLAATYANLDLAIIAVNATTTISGPVIITLDPANPQTAPLGGYSITAIPTGASSINNITFEGSGNTITAPTPQASGILVDAIFKLLGADFITIQNFVMVENAANTTIAAATNNMTEFGVALFYPTTITTNGAQNNTIQNNTITLNRTYQNTWGIYSNSTHSSTVITPAASATTTAGSNAGLKIYGNNISNVNQGICVVGPLAAADFNNGIDIGGASLATANIITNFGTTNAISAYINVSGTVNGILVRNSTTVNISYNTITSSVGGTTAGTLNGIQIPAATVPPTITFTNTINNNNISLQSAVAAGAINGIIYPAASASATSTLNINNNNFSTFGHTVAGSGIIIFILDASTNLYTTINGNTFTNLNFNTTGGVTFISSNYAVPATGSQTINGNAIVGTFNKTGAGGAVVGITSSNTSGATVTSNWSNNNFSNITITGATTLTAINNADGGAVNHNLIGNTISNITGGTNLVTGIISQSGGGAGGSGNLISGNTITNISSTGAITGIFINTAGSTSTVSGNTISGLTTTGASTVLGINSGAPTGVISKNIICNLESNNAAGTVSGINVTTGSLHTISNNRIADLRTPSSASLANPLIGINITNATATNVINVYYNTVYLSGASTGALFGSSAISVSTTPTVTLNNNIFVNASSVTGAGLAVAHRRSSNLLTSYAATSNNNDFFASTIYTDGTTPQVTLAAYKILVATRDASSITENPTFLSTTCGNANFLKINAAVPTQLESSAINIAGITDDFENEIRQGNAGYLSTGTAPDMGADEFTGSSPAPVIALNSFVVSPATALPGITNLCSATARDISITATTPSGTITAVTISGNNGAAFGPIAMTPAGAGVYTYTIPAASPTNTTVTWTISVTNSVGNTVTYTGANYKDTRQAVSSIAAPTTSYCASGTPTISATPAAGYTAGSLQWQSSTTALAGPYTNIVGATGVTYTPGSALTQNTYYQLLVLDGTGVSCGIAPQITITVANPSPLPVTNATRCGNGTVLLSATPSAGASLYWYDALTGGNLINVGNNYTTPLLTTGASTTVYNYYVGAAILGAGAATLGTDATATSTSGITPYTGLWENSRINYLIRASELTAAGLRAGNITSLSFDVTANPNTYQQVNYAIKMAHTSNTNLTGAYGTPTGAFTTVYSVPTLPLQTLGINTFYFGGTPFNWDGVSNVLVEICHETDPTGICTGCWNSNNTVKYTPTSYNSVYSKYADNLAVCGTNSGTTITTFVNRPNMIFEGAVEVCSGAPRALVTATLTPAPTFALVNTTSSTLPYAACNAGITQFDATYNVGDFNNITWTVTGGSLFTDAAATTNPYVAGTNFNRVYLRSSIAGTATVTANALHTTSLCATSGTKSVTILPAITVAAAPPSICVSGTTTLSITPATAASYTGASIQWQNTGGNIAGATGLTYTTPILTANESYNVVLQNTLGASCTTPAPLVIAVNNPQVTAPINGTRCGTGTVLLSATPGAGATLNWYAAATGGTALGTGNTFTTPIINTNTTYYVGASAGTTTGNVAIGPASPTAQGGVIGTQTVNWDVNFETFAPTTLQSVDIFPINSGVAGVIQVRSGTGSTGPLLLTINYTTTVSGGATAQTIPIGYLIATPGAYALYTTLPSGGVSRNTSGAVYPYAAAVASINSNGFDQTYFMGMYNWQFSTSVPCESPRTAVTATVTPAPPLTVNKTSDIICTGSSSIVTVTPATVGNYNSYTWSGGVFAASGTPTGSVVTLSPTASSTTYTLDALNTVSGCANSIDVTVTTTPTPSALTVTPATTATVCAGSAAQLLTASGAVSSVSPTYDFGTGITQNAASVSSTGYPAPYSTYYGGQRMQMLVRASELTAAGYSAGYQFTSVQFPVVSLGSNWGGSITALTDFQVSIGTTALTTLTTFQTGLTQVLAPTTFTPVVGYSNTQTFSAPFTWDGTNNIILETTFSNNIFGTASDVVIQYNTPTTYQSTIVYRADLITSAAAATATTVSFSYSKRPDFKLNGNKTVNPNIVWTPIAGLYTDPLATVPYTGTPTATVYASPLVTTLYTATATTGGCTRTGTSNVIISNGSWSGTVSSDWNNAANWLCGGIPTSASNVTIPAGTPNNPIINATGAGSVNNITVAAGATLTISGVGILNLYGALTSVGNVIATDGTINLAGAAAQTLAGTSFSTGTIKNLKLSNSTSLSSALAVTGNVSYGASNVVFTTNNNLTLISNLAGTAALNDITNNGVNSGNTITGNVSIQRYLFAKRAWRFLAAPVQATGSPSIFNSWQEGGPLTVGFGTQITGPASYVGIDQTTLAGSMKYYDMPNDAFIFVNNTSVPIAKKDGYFVFVRGDRTVAVGGTAVPTTLRIKGQVITGDQTYNVNNLKYLSIGNPYPSRILFSSVSKNNIADAFFVWNPNGLGGNNLGIYETYVNDGFGVYSLNGLGVKIRNYIESGEGFFIQNNDPLLFPGSITIREIDKANGSANVSRAGVTKPTLEINLYTKDATGTNYLADGGIINFESTYSNNIDNNDVRKVFNTADNLAIRNNGKMLVADRRQNPVATDSIFLNLTGTRETNYRFEFDPSVLNFNGLEAFMKDNFLGTETPVSLTNVTNVPFAITADAASKAADRFVIVFKQGASVNFTTISAVRNADKTVNVNWGTQNEVGVINYTLEHSNDGINFTQLNTQLPSANNGSNPAYTKQDVAATKANNWYRVKVNLTGGSVKYTAVAMVGALQEPKLEPSISVYPNPITDRIVNVKFVNKIGRYTLRLIGTDGTTIQTEKVSVNNNNEVKTMLVNKQLAAGNYELLISSSDGTEHVKVVILN